MFYIDCSAETASLVAEETYVGVTVFVAEVTSVCGLTLVSDGIAALYSVCPLGAYLLLQATVHLPFSISLYVLVHCTPPLCMVSYMALP